MRNILRLIFLAAFFTDDHASCLAQQGKFQLLAGYGPSYMSASGNDVVYAPVYLPHAGVYYSAPLGGRVAFVTGLSYQLKGFASRQEVRSIPDDDLDIYQGRTRYDFLNIPLQLSIRLRSRRQCSFWLGGGMNYGFLIRAQADWDWDNYRHGKFRYRNEYISRPPIGLLPRDNRVPTAAPRNYGSVYLFHPAVSASLTFMWHERYLLRTFYEYNLYEVSSEPAIGTLRLHSAGLSCGICF